MRAALRGFLGKFALVALALALTYAACEFVTRLLFRQEAALFPRYHTEYRYGRYALRGVRPNIEYWQTTVDGSWKFTTNSRGMRDTREFEYRKPKGTLRVLSLGDSHTQGFEVRQESTFSAFLERSLRRTGRQAEVLNAGVSGFGTAEQLAYLENEGARYEPDVVVVGFFANDFEDNLKSSLFGLDAHGVLVEEGYVHLPGVRIQDFIYAFPLTMWLSENSYFYSLLFNGVWRFFKERLTESALHRAAGKDGAPAAAREALEYAVPLQATASPHQVRLAAVLLGRMHRFSRKSGMRLIVVDIPTRESRLAFRTSMPEELRAALRERGVEYLASEDVLGAYNGVVEVHLPNGQVHISEFAHALIARAIEQRIVGAPGSPRPQ